MGVRKTTVCFLLIFSFLAAPEVSAQGKIYGQWKSNQFGFVMTLTLRADGTGEFDGERLNSKFMEAS